MNKKYLLVFLGILLSIALLLGSSYAYWMMSHTQTNDNIVSSGCFSTSFTEVENSNINLTNSYPMLDEDGMKTTPYEFTITNTCDTYASFSVNMEVLSSTTLSHDLIKAVLDDGTPKVATEYESTTATIDGATSYVLLTGGLDTDESKTFNFRMWIDESGTLENSLDKSISAKIVVVTTAGNPSSLIEILLAQYKEENSVGLVKDEENPDLYYYVGSNEEVTNNFLWYGGHQWRVLEFDTSANTLTLITQQPLTAIQPASAVWTNEEEYNSSYINQWLNDYFWNSLDNSVQATIQDSTFNIGFYNNVSEYTTTKKVGLLDEEQYKRSTAQISFNDMYDVIAFIESGGDYLSMGEFLQAEGYATMDEFAQDQEYYDNGQWKYYETFDDYLLDEYGVASKQDFIDIINGGGSGYGSGSGFGSGSYMFSYDVDKDIFKCYDLENNYLNIKDYWWLGNRYSLTGIRGVSNDGNLSNYYVAPSYSYGVRAVIKISDLTITGGDGTFANNYRKLIKASNTNNVQVGEYINVPYKGYDRICGSDKQCTMRVVSKDNDKIKVVLNGLLTTTSTWATDASDSITTSDIIYTSVLNPFIANIDSTYITTGTFGVGTYASGNSYKVPAATMITANVGLPTIGEMFSGNDIDLSTLSTKTFVDVATIENPVVSYSYWTMNRYSSLYVLNVNGNGFLNDESPSYSRGVRVIFYLKAGTSALTFTGGEGTPQSPYTLN